MDGDEPGYFRKYKNDFRAYTAVFIGLVFVMVIGYFLLPISVKDGFRMTLGNSTRTLASFFTTTNSDNTEIISLLDENTNQKDIAMEVSSTDNFIAGTSSAPKTAKSKTSTSSQMVINQEIINSGTEKKIIPPRVLISELMTGTPSSSADEFIEIYNPTERIIDLSGFYIKRKAVATGAANNLISKTSKVFNSTSIAPHGFFLVASKGYGGHTASDVYYSQNSVFMADNGDVVMLYDKNDNIIDEIAYGALARGKSWERMAYVNDACVFPQGVNELVGNGCDTGSAGDFILRDVPNPQNSKSVAE